MDDAKSKPLSFTIFVPLLSLIFIRPFISGLAYPTFEIYYENIIIFLAIATLFIEAKYRFKIYPRTFDNFPVILLLLAYSLSTIFSINMQNSIKETIKFISFFAVFFIVSQTDDKQKKILIKTILIAASIISLYSIYQYLWGYDHTLNYLTKIESDFLTTSSYGRDILLAKRAIGTFPSPNILASYLIMALFLAMYLGRGSDMAVFLIIIALILTKSLGAWLSVVFALIALFIFSYNSLKQKRLLIIISFILIITALTFIIITRWERFINLENPQNSITQRLNYWHTAIRIIKEHPFAGIGPGNFHEVFLKYKIGLSTDTRYAHNILLHTWAEAGVLGLIGIFYLIISFIRRFKMNPEIKFIFLSGLAFLLHNLIDNSFFIPEVGLFWWVLLGLSL